jgi:hypothetical protein
MKYLFKPDYLSVIERYRRYLGQVPGLKQGGLKLLYIAVYDKAVGLLVYV